MTLHREFYDYGKSRSSPTAHLRNPPLSWRQPDDRECGGREGTAGKGFGERLRAIRQQRGLTQEELGQAVKVSNRVIAYYEADSAQPPGALLSALALTLKMSADELLGLKPVKEDTAPRTARLLKRLRKVVHLAAADQRAVLKMVDALVASRRRAATR